MPHGLSLAGNNSVWVTDVALHQVFKIKIPTSHVDQSTRIEMVLGRRFDHGASDDQFCQPTSAVETSDGLFVFVADGYCNGRILKFDAKTGQLLTKFGYKTPFYMRSDPPLGSLSVPHSLTLIESKRLVCVADRENRRIQCFNMDTGTLEVVRTHDSFDRIYSVKFDAKRNQVYALTHDVYGTNSDRIIVFNATTWRVSDIISLSQYAVTNAHDLAIDNKDREQQSTVWVANLKPAAVRSIPIEIQHSFH